MMIRIAQLGVLSALIFLGCSGDDPQPAPFGADTNLDTSEGDAPSPDAAQGDGAMVDSSPLDSGGADTAPADTAEEDVELDFTPDPDCEADWVVLVNGQVIDNSSAPIDEAKVQLCLHIGSPDGNLICLRPEDSAADGSFSIIVSNSVRCVGGGAMRVFVPGSNLATTYCHIDTSAEGGILNIAEPIVLFETDDAGTLPAYGDPASPRSVDLGAGFEVPEFVPDALGFTFTEETYNNLGARRVSPEEAGLCFVDGAVDGLIAFRIEANVEEAFDFRMANDSEYDPGATVNLFLLGGLETKLEDGTPVAETAWEQYGTATVSEDGVWIEGRIPAFTWLGYALAE